MTLVGTTRPYFLERGAGDCAVLMLHGIGGSHGAFAHQIEPIAAAGYRALAWDAPGYGFSRSVEPYTLESLALACLDLIDLVDAQHLVLVGHSMGGMIAQQVVAMRPEAVSGLVLVSTSPAFGKSDGNWQREFINQRLAPLDAGCGMAELAATLVPAMLGSAAAPGAAETAIALMSAVSPATYRHAVRALVGFDGRSQLASIKVPTLLVAGSADTTAPAAVLRKMGEHIGASEFVELADVGHILPIEAPDEFNRILLAFLAAHFGAVGVGSAR